MGVQKRSDGKWEVGLCECGCGELAAIAPRTHGALGVRKGEPLRFAVGHKQRVNLAKANAVRLAGLPEPYIVDPTTGCWVWQRGRNWGGYAIHKPPRDSGRSQLVHRDNYEKANGPIPEGLVLDHLCRNPPCVNPDHLEAVTHRENILRGVGMGARAARATHCVNGHPWDEENTRFSAKGTRRCCACRRAYEQRKRAA